MITIFRTAFAGWASLAILAGGAFTPAPLLAQHGGGYGGGHGGGYGGGHGVVLGHGGRGFGHGGVLGGGHAGTRGIVGGHGFVGGHAGGPAFGGHRSPIALHNGFAYHGAFVPYHGLRVGVFIGSPYAFAPYPYWVGYSPYAARYRVAAPAGGDAALDLVIEAAGEGVVRVTWPDGGSGITEVGLFLADTDRQVLTIQTLRASPFTALFDVVAGTAYVGMTVTYADARSVTALVPYAR